MNPIKALVKEHEYILQFLDQLDEAAQRIVRDKGPSREFFEEAMNISREFADKFHHYKEEYVMFGLLAQKKNGTLDGEIERHRNQHEQCRDLIQKITDSLDGYTQKLDSKTRVLHRNLSDYVQTLRNHIRSENEVFFPMVQEALTDSEQERLMDEFAKYESKTGVETLDFFQVRITGLARELDDTTTNNAG